MPDRLGRKVGMEDLLPEDRRAWTKDVWIEYSTRAWWMTC